MRYQTDKQNVDTREFPKSSSSSGNIINPGDIIIPTDGSWTLCLINGELRHHYVGYPPIRKPWKVIMTEGKFPSELYEGMVSRFAQHYPGCRDYNLSSKGEVVFSEKLRVSVINDLMCHCLINPSEILFIHSGYVRHFTEERQWNT